MGVTQETLVLALCTLALYFKVVVTLAKQGAAQQRPPEDVEELGLAADNEAQEPLKKKSLTQLKFDSTERWRRIVNNDMENIPMALIILWAQTIVGANAITTSVCALLFTVARIVHTFCYYYSVQPARSIAFFIGLLSVFCAAFNMLAATL